MQSTAGPSGLACWENQLDQCDLFDRHVDPQSGVVSYLLTRRVAPVQQSFYFINSSFSGDGRFCWFYCAAPPANGRWLGVIDFERGSIHGFPETAFTHSSPSVLTDGSILWTTEAALWRRGPNPNDSVELLNEMPKTISGFDATMISPPKVLRQMASHLSITHDGRGVFITFAVNRESYLGVLPLDGSPFELWERVDRFHNHAQICPADSDLVLTAWEHAVDYETGLRVPSPDRIWLIRKGEKLRPLFPEPTLGTHEWWDRDGQHIWFVGEPLYHRDRANSKPGTYRVNIHNPQLQYAGPWFWHAHDSPDGRFLVGDRHIPYTRFERGMPSSVHFCRRSDFKELDVIGHNPSLLTPGRQYHIDPHPRFVLNGRWITHTTTVTGKVDFALTPVAALIERLN